VSSAVGICKKTGALLGGAVHTLARLIREGFPEEQVVNYGKGYQPGGGAHLDWLDIHATPANHASNTSVALGTIAISPDGTTVYHAGDTGLLSEMELYARLYPMDLVFLPIGGVFTMDANQASFALSLIKPKLCVPIHYASFPMVAQDADEFVRLSRQRAPGVKVLPLKPGEVLNLADLT
jgi:L-ascorbate metabolism protein UlaG (beta-lactamase superfamily)